MFQDPQCIQRVNNKEEVVKPPKSLIIVLTIFYMLLDLKLVVNHKIQVTKITSCIHICIF